MAVMVAAEVEAAEQVVNLTMVRATVAVVLMAMEEAAMVEAVVVTAMEMAAEAVATMAITMNSRAHQASEQEVKTETTMAVATAIREMYVTSMMTF